jgi:hypothetical protein
MVMKTFKCVYVSGGVLLKKRKNKALLNILLQALGVIPVR